MANTLIEMVGKRFGKLVVLERGEDIGYYAAAMWRCQCDCGNSINAKGTTLRNGQKQSCGCWKRGNHPMYPAPLDGGEKMCRSCHKSTPLANFYRCTTRKDGHWVYCKHCVGEKRKVFEKRRKVKGLPGYSMTSAIRLRNEVFMAYSGPKPQCACCGENNREFLSLDHINNDGASHRARVGPTGVFRDIKRRGFPSGYQILCHNCNMAKAFYGTCPHQNSTS